MGVTEFWGWMGVRDREANERTADRWYMAQVAREVDFLRYSVAGMFTKLPPYRKQIKEFLLKFDMTEIPLAAVPPEENPAGFDPPEDMDPELLRVRKEIASKRFFASWGKRLGGQPKGTTRRQKGKASLPAHVRNFVKPQPEGK